MNSVHGRGSDDMHAQPHILAPSIENSNLGSTGRPRQQTYREDTYGGGTFGTSDAARWQQDPRTRWNNASYPAGPIPRTQNYQPPHLYEPPVAEPLFVAVNPYDPPAHSWRQPARPTHQPMQSDATSRPVAVPPGAWGAYHPAPAPTGQHYSESFPPAPANQNIRVGATYPGAYQIVEPVPCAYVSESEPDVVTNRTHFQPSRVSSPSRGRSRERISVARRSHSRHSVRSESDQDSLPRRRTREGYSRSPVRGHDAQYKEFLENELYKQQASARPAEPRDDRERHHERRWRRSHSPPPIPLSRNPRSRPMGMPGVSGMLDEFDEPLPQCGPLGADSVLVEELDEIHAGAGGEEEGEVVAGRSSRLDLDHPPRTSPSGNISPRLFSPRSPRSSAEHSRSGAGANEPSPSPPSPRWEGAASRGDRPPAGIGRSGSLSRSPSPEFPQHHHEPQARPACRAPSPVLPVRPEEWMYRPQVQEKNYAETLSQVTLPLPVTSKSSVSFFHVASLFVFFFLFDSVPRLVYLHLLLRIPSLYFSRVTRIFEDARLSLPDIKRMARARADQWNPEHPGVQPSVFLNYPGNTALPRSLLQFRASWESFIDALMSEWQTLNVVAVLLMSAILTMLQIDDAAAHPITRASALFSLICALMSLLYGCLYIVRFGTMRKMHKASSFAQEAQKGTNIWWNVWVLLAMPAVWLSWSIIMFLTCIMSFIWLGGSSKDTTTSPGADLGIQIGLTVIFSLGLFYFALIVRTFHRYGDPLDREWQRAVDEWIKEDSYVPYGFHPPPPQTFDRELYATPTPSPVRRSNSGVLRRSTSPQNEIHRAQSVSNIVEKERYRAELSDAKSRTAARKSHEQHKFYVAREEARRMGRQEGLEAGRGHFEFRTAARILPEQHKIRLREEASSMGLQEGLEAGRRDLGGGSTPSFGGTQIENYDTEYEGLDSPGGYVATEELYSSPPPRNTTPVLAEADSRGTTAPLPVPRPIQAPLTQPNPASTPGPLSPLLAFRDIHPAPVHNAAPPPRHNHFDVFIPEISPESLPQIPTPHELSPGQIGSPPHHP